MPRIGVFSYTQYVFDASSFYENNKIPDKLLASDKFPGISIKIVIFMKDFFCLLSWDK